MLVRTLILVSIFGLAACASESSKTTTAAPAASASTAPTRERVELSAELTATAQVVALEKATREVTLRGEDGRLIDVVAGDAVRNFDQIAVGDSLKVRYQQSLSASRLPPNSSGPAAGAEVIAARAKPGSKPGGGVGATVSLRVKIASIDTARGIVVFTLPSGELVAHEIATPEGLSFVKGLKVGDLVQIDYREALALSVESIKPKG